MLRHLRAGVYRRERQPRARHAAARRVHVFSKGLTEVRVSAHVRRRCTMSRRALHARFPSRRRIRAVQRYLRARGATNSWSVIDSWGRVHGFAPHRVYVSASLVKAMLLTSYLRGIGNRMPDAAERSGARADDHGLLERRRGHDLLPRRRRRAVPARQGRGHAELLRRRLLGERPLQRRGPGAALQPDRQAGPDRARAPTRAASCPRSSPTSAGASRASPARRASRRSSRAAGAAPACGQLVHEAALFERRRHALLDGGAHRRQPVARVRHRDAAGSGASGCSVLARAAARTSRSDWAAPPPPAARASWTCTGTRRASG